MAAQELVTPTPFMKSLSAADYEALKKDVEERLNKGKQGLEALKRVINQSENNILIQSYESARSPLKVRMSLYKNIKNGFSDISEFKIDNVTKQKVINVYNQYFKPVEEAGKGTIKYDLTSSPGGSIFTFKADPITGVFSLVFLTGSSFDQRIILLFDSQALLGTDIFQAGRYTAQEALDRYAFKVVSDYMFRYILHTPDLNEEIGYTGGQANLLLISTINVETPNEATSDPFLKLLTDTPGGTMGVLNGILQKLNNYVPGSDNFTQPVELDTHDDNTELLSLAENFNDFLSQYDIRFNLNTTMLSKTSWPDSTTQDRRFDYLKKSFYNVIIPSEQLNSITNTKYVQNIWNRIKESRITRAGSICWFYQRICSEKIFCWSRRIKGSSIRKCSKCTNSLRCNLVNGFN
jgi:hypothetical protein